VKLNREKCIPRDVSCEWKSELIRLGAFNEVPRVLLLGSVRRAYPVEFRHCRRWINLINFVAFVCWQPPGEVETSFRCTKESKVDRVNELRDEYAPRGVSESSRCKKKKGFISLYVTPLKTFHVRSRLHEGFLCSLLFAGFDFFVRASPIRAS